MNCLCQRRDVGIWRPDQVSLVMVLVTKHFSECKCKLDTGPGSVIITPLPKHVVLLPLQELCQKTQLLGHIPFWSKLESMVLRLSLQCKPCKAPNSFHFFLMRVSVRLNSKSGQMQQNYPSIISILSSSQDKHMNKC